MATSSKAIRSFAVSAAILLLAPAAAHAAGEKRLCADRVSVWDSPDSFVIAHMYRPQRLRVLATTQHRQWALVHFLSGDLRGWILSGAICP